MRPIYLVNSKHLGKFSKNNVGTLRAVILDLPSESVQKAFVPSEWIIDRPQIIQDNRMEGCVCERGKMNVCVCSESVCVCVHP